MILSWPTFDERAGYLFLGMGSMGSNKSTLAINSASHYHDNGYKTVFINSVIDSRKTNGGEDGKFSSHNSSNRYLNPDIGTLTVSLLSEACVGDYSVIVVDEGQFYTDLVEVVNLWLSMKKFIFIVGLDSNSERKKFGFMTDLIPLADDYYKLKSKCGVCGCAASFTHHGDLYTLIHRGITQIMPGNYVSMCRYHYDLFKY